MASKTVGAEELARSLAQLSSTLVQGEVSKHAACKRAQGTCNERIQIVMCIPDEASADGLLPGCIGSSWHEIQRGHGCPATSSGRAVPVSSASYLGMSKRTCSLLQLQICRLRNGTRLQYKKSQQANFVLQNCLSHFHCQLA